MRTGCGWRFIWKTSFGHPVPGRDPRKLAADFDLVAGELKRIAGSAYTAGLQIHWADVPPTVIAFWPTME